MKLTERKGFNFMRSYYDVYSLLPTDKDRVQFMNAVLDYQFHGKEPENLSPWVQMAWTGQFNNMHQQVRGWEKKTGKILSKPAPPAEGTTQDPTEGATEGGKKKASKPEFQPPTLEEFMVYAKDKCRLTPERYQQMRPKLMRKFQAWDEDNWMNRRTNKRIQNWKTTLLNTLDHL